MLSVYLVLLSLTGWAQDSLAVQNTAGPDSTRIVPDDSLSLSTQTRRIRSWIVYGSSALTIGSTYVYLQKKWWNENGTAFHFDKGRDGRYASNLDKVAHWMGGVFTADVYYDAFRWAGASERKAEWLALGAAAFVQAGIEVKDGFAPYYGFSWRDVAFGTVGGFWPMLQNRSGFLRDAQWKASYWQRTPKYFTERGIAIQRFSIDDYINQTYWFSFSPEHFGGEGFRNFWPDWLQLSVGMGLEAETWSIGHTGEGGRHEWYIAPDINLIKLFKPKSTFAKTAFKVLKYIKIPAPTLRVRPKMRFYWLYF